MEFFRGIFGVKNFSFWAHGGSLPGGYENESSLNRRMDMGLRTAENVAVIFARKAIVKNKDCYCTPFWPRNVSHQK